MHLAGSGSFEPDSAGEKETPDPSGDQKFVHWCGKRGEGGLYLGRPDQLTAMSEDCSQELT